MAITLSLTDLQTDISLLYEGGDDIATLANSVRLEMGPNAEIWHEPDRGERQLVVLEDGDRMFSFNADIVTGTASSDDVLDKLTTIKRWIHGAKQQAALAEIGYPVRAIYLKVKLDGATNATLHRIKRGAVPDLNGMFTQKALLNKVADRLPIHLQLAPYGQAENPIYVNNVLPASPHFLDFADEDGPANGWSEMGTAAATIVANTALIGAYSQQVTCPAINDGIESDAFTVPSNHLALGSCWLRIGNGTVTVSLYDSSGATEVASISGLTAANIAGLAEQSLTDRRGRTWYLVKFEQASPSTATSLTMRAYGTTAGTYFNIDGGQAMTVEAVNLNLNPHFDYIYLDGLGRYAAEVPDGFFTEDPFAEQLTTNYFDAPYGMLIHLARAASSLYPFYSVKYPVQKGKTILASFWVSPSGATSNVDFTVKLLDGAGNVIDSVTDGEGSGWTSYDATDTGADGNTWYQYKLTGVNSDAEDAQLLWECSTGNAADNCIYYFDTVYAYRTDLYTFRNLSIFDGRLYNRDDWETNTNYVNHLDLFNVPGDAPALLRLELRLTGMTPTTSTKRFWFSKVTDGLYPVIDVVQEAEDMSVISSGSGAWSAPGTSGSGGDFLQFLGGAAGDEGAVGHYIDWTLSQGTVLLNRILSFASVPRVAYARVRASDVANSLIWLEYTTSTGETVVGTAKTLGTNDNWEWIELGPVDLPPLDGADNTTIFSTQFEIHVQCNSGETVWLDKVEYLPAGDGNLLLTEIIDVSNYEYVVVDGEKGKVHRLADGTPQTRRGTMWTVEPGNHMTRIVVGWSETDGTHYMSDYVDVRCAVIPRTTGLLGTI